MALISIDGVTIQNGYISGYDYHGGGCVFASNVAGGTRNLAS